MTDARVAILGSTGTCRVVVHVGEGGMAVQIKAESVLLVPVPEAAPLMHQYRLRYDPVAPAGVPEHITALYPFLAPDSARRCCSG